MCDPCAITDIIRVLIPFVHVGNSSDSGDDLTVNNSAKVYVQLQALTLCFSVTDVLNFFYYFLNFYLFFSKGNL